MKMEKLNPQMKEVVKQAAAIVPSECSALYKLSLGFPSMMGDVELQNAIKEFKLYLPERVGGYKKQLQDCIKYLQEYIEQRKASAKTVAKTKIVKPSVSRNASNIKSQPLNKNPSLEVHEKRLQEHLNSLHSDLRSFSNKANKKHTNLIILEIGQTEECINSVVAYRSQSKQTFRFCGETYTSKNLGVLSDRLVKIYDKLSNEPKARFWSVLDKTWLV